MNSEQNRDHVIMVNVPYSEYWTYESAGLFYPGLGVMLLATELKRNGFKVDIIDGAYYPDYHERVFQLISDKTLMVGFSVMTSQIKYAYDLSKKLKISFPNVNIVWGGIHASLFHKNVAQSSFVDYVAQNEFLQHITKFVRMLQDNRPPNMAGVSFVGDDGEFYSNENYELTDIMKAPFVDYTLLDVENYEESYESKYIFPQEEKWKYYIIATGFGCVYKCTFCVNTILKSRYRHRTAKCIVDRIQYLQEKYGANAFCFRDEDFFINRKRLLEFLDLVEERGLKFKWHSNCSLTHYKEKYLNLELLIRVAKSGLVFLTIGGESGNVRVLKELINKAYTLDQAHIAADLLNQVGIKPWFSFMIGLPGEKEEEMLDTCDQAISLQKKLPYSGAVRVFPFRLYPGSSLSEKVVKEGNYSYPETLEKWVDSSQESGFLSIDSYHENPSKIKLFLEYFHYCSKQDFNSSILKKIYMNTLVLLINLRFKHRFFSFPFELKLLALMKQGKSFLSPVKKKFQNLLLHTEH